MCRDQKKTNPRLESMDSVSSRADFASKKAKLILFLYIRQILSSVTFFLTLYQTLYLHLKWSFENGWCLISLVLIILKYIIIIFTKDTKLIIGGTLQTIANAITRIGLSCSFNDQNLTYCANNQIAGYVMTWIG